MKQSHRVSKHDYYLNIAREVAERSTCMSCHFGAIIVKDDQIISTGYNGAPRKTKDCYEIGTCLRRKFNVASGTQYEMCRSVHAEQNAIINAARSGAGLLNGDLYLFGKKVWDGADQLIKAYPCFICKKMILNSGIKRVIGNGDDGSVLEYNVEDWTKEWAENDMIEDTEKYATSYTDNSCVGCCGGKSD